MAIAMNEMSNHDKTAAVSDSTSSPDSVVDLIECKDCGHLVPAQNMVIHELRACQPRKQPAARAEPVEESTLLTEPSLPAVDALESSLGDDYVILPPPTPEEEDVPDANNDDSMDVDEVHEAPVTTTDSSVVSSNSHANNNFWKKFTDIWESWTSCGGAYPGQQRDGQDPSSNQASRRTSTNNQVPEDFVPTDVDHNTSTTTPAAIWSCPRCTLHNAETQPKCEACLYRNPTNQSPPQQGTSFQRGNRNTSQSNNTNNNDRPSPTNYLSAGAILGGVVGIAGAALTGQNPVFGLMEGAVNGAMAGAMVGSAARAQEQVRAQQQRALAASQGSGGPVRIIRRQMPNGTMTVLARPGGRGGPISVRRVPLNDPLEAAMMESLMMGGGGPPLARNNPGVDGMSYDQLLETFGTGSENLGANREQIRSLPSSKVQDPSLLPEDCKQCPICLENFTKGAKRKTLPCLHGFHEKCVDQWLKTNAACPICKHRLDE